MRNLLIVALMGVIGCGGDDGGSGSKAGSGGTTGGTSGGSGGKMARMPKPPRPAAATSSAAPSGPPMDTTASTVGEGGLASSTAQPGDTGDELWLVQEDIDGDGVPDDVYVLIDDETDDKYVFFDGTIDGFCEDGTDANATFLTIFYGDGSQPVALFESDCPEDEGLTYGCDIDEAGNPGACGVCAIDDATGIWVCVALDTGTAGQSG